MNAPSEPRDPAEAITRFTEDRGWTQQELADRLGVSRQTANYIANRKQKLSGAMMLRLSQLTGRPVEYWAALQRQSSPPAPPAAASPAGEGAAWSRPHPGTLVDREISAALQAGALVIDPFDPALLAATRYTLRAGGQVVTDNGPLDASSPAELLPATPYTIETLETLTLPDQVRAHLELAPELGENGFQILGSKSVEPGWDDRPAVTIANLLGRSAVLAAGDPLLRVTFEWLAEVPADVRRRRELARIDKEMNELGERQASLREQRKKLQDKNHLT